MQKLIIHAWVVHKQNGQYYLPYTHWIYLQEIVNYYSDVCLISPVKVVVEEDNQLFPLDCFKNLSVYELPYNGGSYAGAARHFMSYYKAYQKLHKHYDKVYVRYPVPFGWLSKLFFKNEDRTIHFVGYPLEATKLDTDLSRVKKNLMMMMFGPEHSLYVWACKGARVFTNGHHIKDTLVKQGVNATAVISSTLVDDDFYFDWIKEIEPGAPRLLHIGYLRKWKNIDTIINAFSKVHTRHPGATLTIVGEGECLEQLKELASQTGLQRQIRFRPHAAKREELVAYLRSHDIFCFSSISEGSPRVILEAMANGINVVSTPVGSLPFIFKDNEDIMFADFNNEQEFADKIELLVQEKAFALRVRKNAYKKAENFTIKAFIKTIFSNGATVKEEVLHEV